MRNIFEYIFYGYISVVMYLSFTPSSDMGTGNDKINHLLAFVMFTILFEVAFRPEKLPIVFLSGLLFGFFIEFVQYFLPYRSSEFYDIVADFLGIVLGFIMFHSLKKYLKIKKSKI
jgi:VanZ family protein